MQRKRKQTAQKEKDMADVKKNTLDVEHITACIKRNTAILHYNAIAGNFNSIPLPPLPYIDWMTGIITDVNAIHYKTDRVIHDKKQGL